MTWLRTPTARPCDLCGKEIAQGDPAHQGDFTPIIRCASCAKTRLGLDVPAEIQGRPRLEALKAPSSWGRFAAPVVTMWGEEQD